MTEGHSWSDQRILTHLPAARELYAAQKDPSRPFPPPRFISIWISEICNLDCTYCYFGDSNHDPEKTFVNADEIIRWLAEARAFGAEALEFSGGGEPTVHKEFPRIWAAAAGMGYAMGLITHACNPMPLELLATTAKYVRCGLDAATPETHAKVKRKEGRFQKAVENVRELVRLRDSYEHDAHGVVDFTVGIKVVVNTINCHELPQIVRMARELDVDYVQFKHEHSSDHALGTADVERFQKYLEDESHILMSGGRTKVLANLRHQRATTKCFMSPIHTVVSATGKILQCCFMWKTPIGSIAQPLVDVWGGPEHRRVMAETAVEDCDKVDCRWNFFNRRMKEVIEDPLQQASFI